MVSQDEIQHEIFFPIENEHQEDVLSGLSTPLHPVYINASSTAPGSSEPSDYTIIACYGWDSSNNSWDEGAFMSLTNAWFGKDIIGMTMYYFKATGAHPEFSSISFQDGIDLSKIRVTPLTHDGIDTNNAITLNGSDPLPFYVSDSMKLPDGCTSFPGINLCSPIRLASSENISHQVTGFPEEWYDENGSLTSYKIRIYLPSTITGFEISDTSINPFGHNVSNKFGLSEYVTYLNSSESNGVSNSPFKNLLRGPHASVEFYCFNHSELPVITASESAQQTFSSSSGLIKVYVPKDIYSDSLNSEGSWITYYPIEAETTTKETVIPSKITDIVSESMFETKLFETKEADVPVVSVVVHTPSEGNFYVEPSGIFNHIDPVTSETSVPGGTIMYPNGVYLDFDGKAPEEIVNKIANKDITVIWDGLSFHGYLDASVEDPNEFVTFEEKNLGLIFNALSGFSIVILSMTPLTNSETHTLEIYLGSPSFETKKIIKKEYVPYSDQLSELLETVTKISDLDKIDFAFLEPKDFSTKVVIGYDDTMSFEFEMTGNSDSEGRL
jgi:hypothetical protein